MLSWASSDTLQSNLGVRWENGLCPQLLSFNRQTEGRHLGGLLLSVVMAPQRMGEIVATETVRDESRRRRQAR
jgi:hypothetical protein